MVNSFSKILGVKIFNLSNYCRVYETLKKYLKSAPSYITVNNVHTVVKRVLIKKYKEAINNSFLALSAGKLFPFMQT